MFGNILSTFFSRVFTMMIMFGIVVLNAHVFGAEGVGTIGLMILNITILQMITSFVGGTTLVYLIPRRNTKMLLLFSLVWAFFGNLLGLIILYRFSLVPPNYVYLLLGISIVFSLNSINLTVLQAFEKIRIFNLFQILQSVLLILALTIGLFIDYHTNSDSDVSVYFYSFLISYSVSLLFSTISVFKILNKRTTQNSQSIDFENKKWFSQFKELVTLGFWVQVANLAQLFNYRLNYYFIEWFVGRKPLGIFDMGTKISEAIWVFPKSLCLVQYARLANNTDSEYARKVTLIFTKISALFTLMVLIFLLLLPVSFYTFIFGTEFEQVKTILMALAPGVFFLSCLTVFSHHLAAKGLYWKNALSSFVGLLFTAVGGYFLIPIAAKSGFENAIFMAGIVTSVSYFSSFIVTLLFFHQDSKLRWADFMISTDDFQTLKGELLKIIQRKSSKK